MWRLWNLILLFFTENYNFVVNKNSSSKSRHFLPRISHRTYFSRIELYTLSTRLCCSNVTRPRRKRCEWTFRFFFLRPHVTCSSISALVRSDCLNNRECNTRKRLRNSVSYPKYHQKSMNEKTNFSFFFSWKRRRWPFVGKNSSKPRGQVRNGYDGRVREFPWNEKRRERERGEGDKFEKSLLCNNSGVETHANHSTYLTSSMQHDSRTFAGNIFLHRCVRTSVWSKQSERSVMMWSSIFRIVFLFYVRWHTLKKSLRVHSSPHVNCKSRESEVVSLLIHVVELGRLRLHYVRVTHNCIRVRWQITFFFLFWFFEVPSIHWRRNSENDLSDPWMMLKCVTSKGDRGALIS